jgi:hypothetical protein
MQNQQSILHVLPTLDNAGSNLTSLANQFTEPEIRNIVFHMAKGKASGPDGFPVDQLLSKTSLTSYMTSTMIRSTYGV